MLACGLKSVDTDVLKFAKRPDMAVALLSRRREDGVCGLLDALGGLNLAKHDLLDFLEGAA